MFENGGEFAKIFEFQIADDDAAASWLSDFNGTAESKLSGVIAPLRQNLVVSVIPLSRENEILYMI
jgi:hypothetical protein